MKKALTIGCMAVALLTVAHTPAGGRVAQSVRTLERHLQTPSSARSISAFERLVLSLATVS